MTTGKIVTLETTTHHIKARLLAAGLPAVEVENHPLVIPKVSTVLGVPETSRGERRHRTRKRKQNLKGLR